MSAVKQLFDELANLSLATRKKAAKQIPNLLSSPSNVSYLTENSLNPVRDAAAVSWSALLYALTAIFESEFKASPTRRPPSDSLDSIRLLISVADSSGFTFLSEPMKELFSQIILFVRSDESRHNAYGGSVSDIVRVALCQPAYAHLLSRSQFEELFDFYSALVDGQMEISSGIPVNNRAIPQVFQRLSGVCSQILSRLILTFPPPLIHFSVHRVFPFFLRISSKLPDTAAHRHLLSALNHYLLSNSLTLISPLREFLHAFLTSLFSNWPKQTLMKFEYIRMLKIAVQIHRSVSSPVQLFSSLAVSHPIVRCLIEEFSSNRDAILFSQAVDPRASEFQLRMDANTNEFIRVAANIVAIIRDRDKGSKAAEMTIPSRDENESEERERAQKRRRLADNTSPTPAISRSTTPTGDLSSDSIWSAFLFRSASDFLSISQLKFLTIFFDELPNYFLSDSKIEILMKILDSISKLLVKGKSEAKFWCLAALEKLAAGQHRNIAEFIRQSSNEPLSIRYSSFWFDFVELLLRKLIFDEKRPVARQAISLLAVAVENSLIQQSQLSDFNRSVSHLPAIRLLLTRPNDSDSPNNNSSSLQLNNNSASSNSSILILTNLKADMKGGDSSIDDGELNEIDNSIIRLFLAMKSIEPIEKLLSAASPLSDRFIACLVHSRLISSIMNHANFSEIDCLSASHNVASLLLLTCRMPFRVRRDWSFSRLESSLLPVNPTEIRIFLENFQFSSLIDDSDESPQSIESQRIFPFLSTSSADRASRRVRLVTSISHSVESFLADIRTKFRLSSNQRIEATKMDEIQSASKILLHWMTCIGEILQSQLPANEEFSSFADSNQSEILWPLSDRIHLFGLYFSVSSTLSQLIPILQFQLSSRIFLSFSLLMNNSRELIKIAEKCGSQTISSFRDSLSAVVSSIAHSLVGSLDSDRLNSSDRRDSALLDEEFSSVATIPSHSTQDFSDSFDHSDESRSPLFLLRIAAVRSLLIGFELGGSLSSDEYSNLSGFVLSENKLKRRGRRYWIHVALALLCTRRDSDENENSSADETIPVAFALITSDLKKNSQSDSKTRNEVLLSASAFFLIFARLFTSGLICELTDENSDYSPNAKFEVRVRDLFDYFNQYSGDKSFRISNCNRLIQLRCVVVGLQSCLLNSFDRAGIIMKSIAIDDYSIRLFAAHQVKSLVSLSENPLIVLNSFLSAIQSALKHIDTAVIPPGQFQLTNFHESQFRTLISTLANFAVSGVESVVRLILLKFCEFWDSKVFSQPEIKSAVKQLESALDCGAPLFSPAGHLHYLLIEFLSSDRPLDRFPRQLLPFEPPLSHSEFVAKFEDCIVSSILFLCPNRSDALVNVAETLNSTVAELLEHHFPSCFARFYSLYRDDSTEFATLCLEYFRASLTEPVFNRLFADRQSDIIFALVEWHLLAPDHTLCPAFGASELQSALRNLADNINDQQSIGKLIVKSSEDRIQRFIMKIKFSIAETRMTERQWRAIGILQLLLTEFLSIELVQSAIFRFSLDALIWLLRQDYLEPRSSGAAAELLIGLIDKIFSLAFEESADPPISSASASLSVVRIRLQCDLTADEIGRHTRRAISSLLDWRVKVMRCDEQNNHVCDELLKNFLFRIATLSPLGFLHQLADLPFPIELAFPEAPESYRNSISPFLPTCLQAELARFLRYLPESANFAAPEFLLKWPLRHLLNVLKQNYSDLISLIANEKSAQNADNSSRTNKINAFQVIPNARLIGSLIAGLLHINRSKLADLSSRCLGLIGSVDPQLFNSRETQIFRFGCDFGCGLYPLWGIPGAGAPTDLSPVEELKNQKYLFFNNFHHREILVLLDLLSRHPSLPVVNQSLNCLKSIFLTKSRNSDVINAFDSLPDRIRVYLSPFNLLKSSRNRIQTQEAKPLIEDWIMNSIPFDEWICRLTASLLLSSADQFLSFSAPAASISPDFALRIFPYAIFSSLISGNYSFIAARFNSIFNLPFNNSARFRSVIQVSLHALQFIRDQNSLLYRQPINFEKGKNSLGHSFQRPRDRENQEILNFINEEFESKLDLLSIAEKCRAVDYPLSAIRNIEFAQMRKAEREKSAPAAAAAAEMNLSFDQRLNSLLLSCYRSIDEPDGIYGVLAISQSEYFDPNFSSDSEIIIAQREGDQAKLLQIFDAKTTREKPATEDNDNSMKPTSQSQSQNQSQSSNFDSSVGLFSALSGLGCHQLLDSLGRHLRSASSSYRDIAEKHFEAAWRVGRWDFDKENPILMQGVSEGFQSSLFNSIRSIVKPEFNSDSIKSLNVGLSAARSVINSTLSSIGPEQANQLFPALVKLNLLSDIEQAAEILAQRNNHQYNNNSDNSLSHSDSHHLPHSLSFRRFEELSQIRFRSMQNSFDLVDPLLALHSVVLRSTAGNSDLFVSHLRFVCEFSRIANKPRIGQQWLRQAAEEFSSSASKPLSVIAIRLEQAQLHWTEGNASEAIRIAKFSAREAQKFANSEGGNEYLTLASDSFILLGDWLSRSHASSSSLIEENLTSAAALSRRLNDPSSRAFQLQKVLFHMGEFYDRAFQQLKEKESGAENESARALISQNAKKIRDLAAIVEAPGNHAILMDSKALPAIRLPLQSKYSLLARLRREQTLDELSVSQFDRSLTENLQRAIDNYTEAMILGCDNDSQAIYRLVSLWFSHYSTAATAFDSAAADIRSRTHERILHIPSHKFLPLLYQIASRLSTSPGIFPTAVNKLIEKLCVDHPYHSLYQIFALAQGGNTSRVAFPSEFEANEARIKAAKELLGRMKSIGQLSRTVTAMERVVASYISLGNKKFKSGTIIEVNSTAIGSISESEIQLLPPATLTIPVRFDGDYSNIPRISSFRSTIRVAPSGINAPLILDQELTDGSDHKQLLKPSDDLRQDAVMEQLFKLVNQLLLDDRECAARGLNIRTYNVIPLSPAIGLVEWVLNTLSLSDVLVDPRIGAHSRYRSSNQKYTCSEATSMLYTVHKNSPAEYASRFKEVWDEFPPVFHRHFMDAFPVPSVWFDRRTVFTRSIAVSSIVGYIVGLGDRHLHNILLDQNSAEIVHIDLGVAFDAGKTLKTPEIVPFRLTRDLVAAMGITGAEGIFRRICERTLKVLRAKSLMLLTVLEVFVHDPLHKWAISPAKMQQLRPAQNENEEELEEENGNKTAATTAVSDPNARNSGAERAMLNVRQRLNGVELKEALSVEGQVSALIQAATNYQNLEKMYFGWAAFI